MQGLAWRESRRRADEMLRRSASRTGQVGVRLLVGHAVAAVDRPGAARRAPAARARRADPGARSDRYGGVGRLLRRTAAQGVAVLLSSHRLDEIEAVCDRLVVIVGGRRPVRRCAGRARWLWHASRQPSTQLLTRRRRPRGRASILIAPLQLRRIVAIARRDFRDRARRTGCATCPVGQGGDHGGRSSTTSSKLVVDPPELAELRRQLLRLRHGRPRRDDGRPARDQHLQRQHRARSSNSARWRC